MYDIEKLQTVLKIQGRSQNWLAEQTDYDRTSISKFLNGHRPITEQFAERAANALGIPVEWLMAEPEPVHAA